MFALAKWYLDLVTDDGTAVIGHSARLRWGPLRTGHAALLVSPASGPPTFTSTIRPTPPPILDPTGTRLEWRAPRLAIEGSWLRDAEPLSAALLEGVAWHSPMPRARVEVIVGKTRYGGWGYLDHLELRLPPHRLPFHRLRWGRHLSGRHHVTWIGWGEGIERRWVWRDGMPQAGPEVTGTGVTFDDRSELRWAVGRDLVDRQVRTLFRPMGALLRLPLALSTGAMRERKRVARSTLREPSGQVLDRGWTIHEEVTW